MNNNRRKREEEEVKSEWINVYGDMVTLLLTFFVLLFSFSTIDAEKWRALVKTFGSGGKVIVIGESNGGNDKGSVTVSEVESIDPVSKPPELSSTEPVPSSSTSSSSAPVSKPSKPKPSSSTSSSSKPKEPSSEPSSEPSGNGTSTVFPGFEELYQKLVGYVSQTDNSGGVIVDRGEGTIRIRFIGTVLFEPSSAEIKSEAKKVIKDIAKIIDEHINEINFLESQGHTDNAPITNGLYKDNWELSGVRAYNVLTELIRDSNIDKKKVKFSGFGEEHPIDTNETQEGRNRNNRVDILIS